MATIFLLIIYLAFISLGLPDSVLGVAWPVMQSELAVPIDEAGWLSLTISGSTIISSLTSSAVLKRFGTGKVTFVSCAMTAMALLGFSVSPSIVWLILCAIPLGLGAGAVDSGLNHYVAANYKAHHMSWLHCFWGVGATLGPIIMAQFISGQGSWRHGYLTIALIQLVLVVILFVSLPLWNKPTKNNADHSIQEREEGKGSGNVQINSWKIRGVKLALMSFFFYCGAEATMGLWGSSFLVHIKDLPAAVAARWTSFFYGGITIGRFVTGFITLRVGNLLLIRTGQIIAILGAALFLFPLPTGLSLVGFVMVGLGLAPIFPCMLHETPLRFGNPHAQTIMGYQMAVAYTGSTLMPPLLGYVAAHSTIGIFPIFIVVFIAAMLLGSEILNGIIKKRDQKTIHVF